MKYDILEVRKELDTLIDWTWWELKIISDHLMAENNHYEEEDFCAFKEDFFELSIMLDSLERIAGKKYNPDDYFSYGVQRPWHVQKFYKAEEQKARETVLMHNTPQGLTDD